MLQVEHLRSKHELKWHETSCWNRKDNDMILDTIVEDKKRRLIEQKDTISLHTMRDNAYSLLKDKTKDNTLFYHNLAKPGISIIGEFKKASPSAGDISSSIDLLTRIDEYNNSVDAISCLTEEDHFKGSIEYLKEIRRKSNLPILRKDFMIDEYQFYEAKVIGADAILLICAILDDSMLKSFYQLSMELGLDVLVECHDEYEIERALEIEAPVIGINNRNLNDFTISLDTTKRLKKYIPEEIIVVSESGIKTDDDVRFLKDLGVDAFLIGQSFMEADSPRELARKWKEM